MRKKIIIVALVFVILILISFVLINVFQKNEYYIKASAIDKNSPDLMLNVYKNDTEIEVKAIYYLNGVLLCNGNNLTTNKFNIKNNDQLKVVLKNDKEATAKVVMEE